MTGTTNNRRIVLVMGAHVAAMAMARVLAEHNVGVVVVGGNTNEKIQDRDLESIVLSSPHVLGRMPEIEPLILPKLDTPTYTFNHHSDPAFQAHRSFDDRMIKAKQPHYGARMHARTYPK
ncbi:hypothetical protein [Micavibrio aeruginosavorus]|uniref:hypothetical protein n=1 Tax=Micavibrio aeruginosavorus TaxID=349221 RepID=UPI003F4A9FEE